MANLAMELRVALSARELRAQTPLRVEAWRDALAETGLDCKYPNLSTSIEFGFNVFIPPIHKTFAPPNRISDPDHQAAFKSIVQKELLLGRWLGPYPRAVIEEVLGPFQTSPISMVPKPGKPGKFRLVQNFSHPHSPITIAPSTTAISSINSSIDSTLYPCFWGTFANTCRLLWTLPPGSQGAVRDLSEAYRMIPLHPSQWPGTVTRISDDDEFGVDTCNMFGFGPAGGVFGSVADAGMMICRARGLGPLSK